LDRIIDRVYDAPYHCNVIVRYKKFLGQYFLEDLPRSQLPDWKKDHSFIVPEIRSHQETLDFGCKLKRTSPRIADGGSNTILYYIPNFGVDEVAIIFHGHHVTQDGTSCL
jgi:hypothetical protein